MILFCAKLSLRPTTLCIAPPGSPGGTSKEAELLTSLIFHSAPFSYFYHGAPADFWRYTPDGFSALFPTLKPIMSEFYGGSRRRDNRGSKINRVDRNGGADFAPDAFGGWRENWTTIFCGQKCPDHLNALREQTRKQFIVDIMKRLISDGHPLHTAARVVTDGLRLMAVGPDLKLRLADQGGGFRINPSYCRDLFLTRKSQGVDVSYNCFAAWERFKYLVETIPTDQDVPTLPGRGSAAIRAMIRARAGPRRRLRG